MSQQSTWGFIIVAMLIIGVVFAPPVISDFMSGMRDIFEDLRDTFLGDWMDGSNGDGFSSLGITIHYTDGTTDEYEPKDEYKLIPLRVVLGEKEVESIEFFASAKISYTGDISKIAITGTMHTHTHPSEGSIRTETISTTITDVKASGQWFGFASTKVWGYEIEDAVLHDGMTSVMLQLDITDFTVTMQSGETRKFTSDVEAGVTVWVESGSVESVSLDINTNILYGS